MKIKTHFNQRNISRVLMLVIMDAVLVCLSMYMALLLRYDMRIPRSQMIHYSNIWPIMTGICILSFAVCGMYRSLLRYVSLDDALHVILGTVLGAVLTYLFSLAANAIQPMPNLFLMPRTVYLIFWNLLMLTTVLTRFSVRLFQRLRTPIRAISGGNHRRVMVVGAGWAGAQTIRELTLQNYRNGMPVVVVDDNPAKSGSHINMIPVVLGTENIPRYVESYLIDDIIIAIPSAKAAELRPILDICKTTTCGLKMVPAIRSVQGGELTAGAMRDVSIADLLYRDEVELDIDSINEYLRGRVVLVTGGGGSIGSELCRQIARFKPKHLIVFEIYENGAYELETDLRQEYGDELNLTLLVGSVRDMNRLEDVFKQYRPYTIFHAAAHKHVPMMEGSPAEAIKNNVFGTLNVAICADKYGANRMVIPSTDKAVNPTSVMGASKRVCEMVLQYMAGRSNTLYMAVRFGNVLGSNGSVVPKFRAQIARGGPVTLTHPDITRYFMTIPEAAQLVLQAAASGESGAIYVLDMGTPVKMIDLARDLIRLSGFTPDEDIKIVYTGLRPGEKLYEELAMAEEQDRIDKTKHEKIFVTAPVQIDAAWFEDGLNRLRDVAENHPERAADQLRELVPTFVTPDFSAAEHQDQLIVS